MAAKVREGVAIFQKQDQMSCVVERKEISPRWMRVKMRVRREKWEFGSGYGPRIEKGEEKKNKVLWNQYIIKVEGKRK